MKKSVLGVIGGSGLYDMPLEEARLARIESPWGEVSDDLLFGVLSGLEIVFLPRHGRGHHLSPSTINYRANIDALKRCGVTEIISLSACGSFREHLPPGTFVIVDQFIDRTFLRPQSFFGTGCVAHVSLAEPVSPLLGDFLEEALRSLSIPYHRGGTYLCMEGPQFSTMAESRMYRTLGADVIGMTNMPEARLAREAEIPYATVAMVTDFDSWHPDHGCVDIRAILETMRTNTGRAKALVEGFAQHFPKEHPACPIGSDRALEYAIMTKPENRDRDLVARLGAIAGRVLG